MIEGKPEDDDWIGGNELLSLVGSHSLLMDFTNPSFFLSDKLIYIYIGFLHFFFFSKIANARMINDKSAFGLV